MRPDLRAGFVAAAQKLRPGGADPVLATALVAVGFGNLILPAVVQDAGPIDYLLVSLAVCILFVALGVRIVIGRLRCAEFVLLFCLAAVPAFFVAPLNGYGITKALAFGIAAILMVAPSAFRRPTVPYRLVLLLIGASSAVLTVLLFVFGEPTSSGRFSVFDLNPIAVARSCALLAVIAVAVSMTHWRLLGRSRWVLLTAALVALACVIATGSRGPLLSAVLALGGLVVVLVLLRRIGGRVVAILAATGAAGVGVLAVVSPDGLGRILRLGDSGRGDLFAGTLTAFMENPLGIGWGNLANYLPEYGTPDGFTLYPHNIFLEIGSEGGVFALIAFVALIVSAIVVVVKAAKDEIAVAPALLAVLLFALANAQFSSDIVGNRLLWLALGLIFALPVGNSPRNPMFRSRVAKSEAQL
ncbi:O-antigen ligase family protein [Marisediminicola antarctica]|uniref:O-antigen ligase-related domain-containing protein n=1 Tax=Marisediminicola antarctica TaxID=674079 RepID=A0A7L5AKI2_9MICO|nr:O-antigen ligase family protein [Marisediminicola antarctica]QHO68809.1 hypothetical protein BHD05_03300 [Marisediminicola antarctica]